MRKYCLGEALNLEYIFLHKVFMYYNPGLTCPVTTGSTNFCSNYKINPFKIIEP